MYEAPAHPLECRRGRPSGGLVWSARMKCLLGVDTGTGAHSGSNYLLHPD